MDDRATMGGHCYRVAVLCEGGENGEYSNESCATFGPCYPPRNLDYELTNNYKIKLKWDAPEPHDGLSGYNLYRKDGDGEYRRIKPLNANAVTCTDNSVQAEGDYYYRLYAYYGALDCTSSPANRKYHPNEFELHVYYSPTGISETTTSVKVYPNPTQNTVTVEADGMTSVSVFNTLGQCILQKEVTEKQTVLDLQDEAPGLYLLHITTESGTLSKHIAIIH